MTSIFNTSREYPRMHVWCKFGDSSSNLWRIIVRTSKSLRKDVRTYRQTDIRRQLQCLLSLKGQGVKTIIIQNRHTIFRMIFLYANTHGWTKIMDMCSHARYYHITVDQMKSSTPSAAYTWYMRKWIRWALVQKTACRLFDAKPLYRQLNPWEQTSGNFNQSTKRFIHENASENIAWDILSSGEIS